MSHSVVIGGAGFVGSWVVEEILKIPSARVTIVDNLISSEQWNVSLDPRVTFIKGSAANLATFENISGNVDFVFQLACFHGNQSSIARPLDDLENGLKSTLTTLEWVKIHHPSARIIYSGAGCAVAEKTWNSPVPAKEIDVTSLQQDSPYSISKITGEMYSLFYANYFDLDVVRVRFQNIYGPREILGAGTWRGTENTIWRNVIPTFIWKAINNELIEVYGEATRDFIYVSEIARGVLAAAKMGKRGEVYNLAGGKEINIKSLAENIVFLVGSKSKIKTLEKRSWDNSGRRIGDVSKSSRLLNFQTTIPIEQGLLETIKWTRLNYMKINETINKHKSAQ